MGGLRNNTVWQYCLLAMGLVFMSAPQAEGDDLIYAAKAGDLAKVKQELEAGADINVHNGIGDALYFATDINNKEMVVYLLERGIDHEGPFAIKSLHHAIRKGFDEIALLLLKYDFDVNGLSVYGRVTPLMAAARYGRIAVAHDLLARGAAFNLTSDFGGTALQQAIIWGHEDVAELLRSRRAEDAYRPFHDPQTQIGAFMKSFIDNSIESPEKRRLYYEDPNPWYEYAKAACYALSQGQALEMVEFQRRKNFGDKIGNGLVEASIATICPEARPVESPELVKDPV